MLGRVPRPTHIGIRQGTVIVGDRVELDAGVASSTAVLVHDDVLAPARDDHCRRRRAAAAAGAALDLGNMPDLDELLQIAASVARSAGELLLDGLHRARTSVRTKSSRTDMVTEMDLASESHIVTSLHQQRPGDAI